MSDVSLMLVPKTDKIPVTKRAIKLKVCGASAAKKKKKKNFANHKTRESLIESIKKSFEHTKSQLMSINT